MLRLLQDDFVKVVKYIQEAPSFVYSVLEGIIPGSVSTDSSNNAFLIGTTSGIFYVFGCETNTHFNNSLLEVYKNQINKKARFTLFSSSRKWDKVIADLFKDDVSKLSRYAFTFNEKCYSVNKVQLPKAYLLEKIDEVLFSV